MSCETAIEPVLPTITSFLILQMGRSGWQRRPLACGVQDVATWLSRKILRYFPLRPPRPLRLENPIMGQRLGPKKAPRAG